MSISAWSSLLLLCVVLVQWGHVDARVGSPRRRRRQLFQHRKMQWASEEEEHIEGQYIIVFNPETSDDAIDSLQRGWLNSSNTGAKIKFQFNDALKAIVVSRLSANILKVIIGDDRILWIEEVCNARLVPPHLKSAQPLTVFIWSTGQDLSGDCHPVQCHVGTGSY